MKINNIKRKLLSLFLIFFYLFLVSGFVQAALVPCGGEGQPACQLCHLFVMFDNIVRFILHDIVPPAAILMIVIAGIMFFFYADDPDSVNKAKSIIKSVVIGLILIYAAWIIINTFFAIIGVEHWTGLKEGWFKINCP